MGEGQGVEGATHRTTMWIWLRERTAAHASRSPDPATEPPLVLGVLPRPLLNVPGGGARARGAASPSPYLDPRSTAANGVPMPRSPRAPEPSCDAACMRDSTRVSIVPSPGGGAAGGPGSLIREGFDTGSLGLRATRDHHPLLMRNSTRMHTQPHIQSTHTHTDLPKNSLPGVARKHHLSPPHYYLYPTRTQPHHTHALTSILTHKRGERGGAAICAQTRFDDQRRETQDGRRGEGGGGRRSTTTLPPKQHNAGRKAGEARITAPCLRG